MTCPNAQIAMHTSTAIVAGFQRMCLGNTIDSLYFRLRLLCVQLSVQRNHIAVTRYLQLWEARYKRFVSPCKSKWWQVFCIWWQRQKWQWN